MPTPTIELQLSGVWTDVSQYVRYESGITISRGRSEWASSLEPSRASLTFDDTDGRFDPRNPVGAYYGSIGRNTSIRISANNGTPFLAVAGGASDNASTPDAAALDIVSDIDIQIEASLNWNAGSAVELASKYLTTGDQRSWALWITASGTINYRWSTLGTLASVVDKESTSAIVFPPDNKLALRVTHDVSDGGNNVVRFYTSDSITGTWTQLGNAVTTAGVTSIFSSTAVLQVGQLTGLTVGSPVGRIRKFKLLSGIAGTEVANPDWTAQTVGAASFADSAGRTWTMNGNAAISRKRVRFTGEVSSWPPRWDVSGNDITVPIEAAGVSRRLGQGASPLESTLRRRIPSDADLLAYWPMEEGENASRIASPVTGVAPMAAVGGVTFAAVDTLPGSAALPTLATGASISGQVPAGSGAGWHTELVYNISSALPATLTTLFQVHVTGSTIAKALVRASTTAIRIELRDADDAVISSNETANASAITAFSGQWNRLQVYADDTAADVAVYLWWIPIETAATWFVSTTATGTSPGNVRTVTTGAVSADYSGIAMGHLAVFDTTTTTTFDDADDGFNAERATARVERLCDEEGLTFVEVGTSTVSEPMGAQARDTLLTLLGSCADADGGLLFEGREATSIAYRDRSNLYNQPAALELDYAAFDLYGSMEPVDDDQQTRNKVTVTRSGGSSGTAVKETGPLSILAPPNGVGKVEESVTLSLYEDAQAEQIAAWRVHLGTVDELRLPTVTVHLARQQFDAALIADALDADIGDRLTVANPPTAAGPDTISQIIQGYSERFDQFEHTITYNCTPGSPYQVAETDHDVLARAGTDGSQLASSATSTATTISVAATGDNVWATADPPLNSNGSFETDLSQWSGSGATISRVATPPTNPSSGEWSMMIVPDGVSEYPNGGSDQFAVTAGTSYTLSGWLRCATARGVALNINWFNGGGYLSTSSNDQPVEAGVWEFFSLTATAPVGATLANAAPTVPTFPPATDVLWVEELWLRPYNAAQSVQEFPFRIRVGGEVMTVIGVTSTTSPQTFTVVRSANGVVKAQSSSAPVVLATPAIVAL